MDDRRYADLKRKKEMNIALTSEEEKELQGFEENKGTAQAGK